MRTFTLFLTLCLGLCTCTHAKIQPVELTTKSGILFWFLKDKKSPVIALSFNFKGGTQNDPKGKEGLTHLAVSCLMEGTAKRTPKALSEYLQDIASSYAFDASDDDISGSLTTLLTYKDKAFALLNEALTSPRLTEDTLKKIKDDHLINLAELSKAPHYLASQKLSETLFKGQAYAVEDMGTPDKVKKITNKDIGTYIQTFLSKDRLIVSLSGNLTEEEAADLVDKAFANLPETSPAYDKTPLTPNIKAQVAHVDLNVPQTTLLFALPGITYDHPDFLKASLLMHIMGSGMTSRLFIEIREKRGLAYSVGAGNAWRDRAGYISGYMGTTTEKTAESKRLLKKVWDDLKAEGITQQELDDAKTYTINSYPLRFTDSSSTVAVVNGFQRANRPLDYFQKRSDMIQAITLEQMNQFIKDIIEPEKITFVTVGRKG